MAFLNFLLFLLNDLQEHLEKQALVLGPFVEEQPEHIVDIHEKNPGSPLVKKIR